MASGTSLLTETGRDVFETLCKYPCSGSRVLNDECITGPQTVETQLIDLADDGMVYREKRGKVYKNCPSNFIPRDLLGIYYFLNGVQGYKNRRKIFKAVLEQPGITTLELADRVKMNRFTLREHTRGIVPSRYFYSEQKGRTNLYFPDYGRFKALQVFHTNKKFQNNFLDRLERAIVGQFKIHSFRHPKIEREKFDEGKPTEREKLNVDSVSTSFELTIYQNPIGLIAGDLSLFSKKRGALAPVE